ncbi:MAG: hypothetical protein KGZ64_10295, partial [Thermaerobacter sp.]|nr:hypothetical protein [Thermaerobacter sp.]MBS4055138.1 hypothetical protein [Thermaerobacter sp.]
LLKRNAAPVITLRRISRLTVDVAEGRQLWYDHHAKRLPFVLFCLAIKQYHKRGCLFVIFF